jgi:hypothetical protein
MTTSEVVETTEEVLRATKDLLDVAQTLWSKADHPLPPLNASFAGVKASLAELQTEIDFVVVEGTADGTD